MARFTLELLGPVPLTELVVTAAVLRPGRSVRLMGAELVDPAAGRAVASARAWVLPDHVEGPGAVGPSPTHGPRDGVTRERPAGWSGGYLDAVGWRWVTGGLDEPGPGTAWMRPPALVEGEETTPLQRVLSCADSASGVSSVLDAGRWAFLNTELTVHLLRPHVGAWVGLDAVTEVGPGSAALATSTVLDERGPVGRTAQTLLVAPRG